MNENFVGYHISQERARKYLYILSKVSHKMQSARVNCLVGILKIL